MMKKVPYKLSDNLRIVSIIDSKMMFIYHALYGNPKVINQETLDFLELFKKDVSVEQLHLLYQEYPEEIIEEFSKILFLVSDDLDERKLLEQKKLQYLSKAISGQTIDRMGLGISKACNFQCTHCINHDSYRNDDGLISKKSNVKLNISWEMAKKCIDKYVSLVRTQGKEDCTIHFGTAEPLINWPIIEKTLKYCSEIYSDLTFVFSINTNLSLLTKDIAKVLKQYNVEISTSLDGMMESNDSIRKTGGKGTFNLIVDKFDLLNEVDYPLDGFSITATSANFDLINKDIVDFAFERKMTSIAFDYNLVDAISIPVEVRVEKLMSLKRYANEKNIEFFGTWSHPFRNIMSESILTGDHAFCAAVQGKLLEFDVDGNIKICGYSSTTLGHVELFDNLFEDGNKFYQMIENRFPGINKNCHGCSIEGACAGQCNVTREAISRLPEEQGLLLMEDMCNFYRLITEKLIQEYIKSVESEQKGGGNHENNAHS